VALRSRTVRRLGVFRPGGLGLPFICSRPPQGVPELWNLVAEGEQARRGRDRLVGDGGSDREQADHEDRVGRCGSCNVPITSRGPPVTHGAQVLRPDLGVAELVEAAETRHRYRGFDRPARSARACRWPLTSPSADASRTEW